MVAVALKLIAKASVNKLTDHTVIPWQLLVAFQDWFGKWFLKVAVSLLCETGVQEVTSVKSCVTEV